MKTVVGLFDTHAHAERAAHDLEKAGISHDDISLIANNASGQFGDLGDAPTDKPDLGDTESETGKGAVAGGVAGLLVGLAALVIPGLGAIAAVGWLATMAAGALVGAGVGLVGALSGVGVSHEEAAYYTEGVRRGGTLLAARVPDDQAKEIEQLLSSDGAVDINERAEQYRQEGFVPEVANTEAKPTAARKGKATAATLNEPSTTEAADNATIASQKDTLAETAPPAAPITPLQEQLAASASMPAGNGRTNEDAGTSQTAPEVHARIEVRAYYLYDARGRGDGLALHDWLAAEREILTEPVNRSQAVSVGV